MKTNWAPAILLLFSAVAHAQNAWPMRFAWNDDRDHMVLVLYRDGRAAYSLRTVRQDGSNYYFAASQAKWGLCALAKPIRPLCISVHVEGNSSGVEAGFRFDYLLDGAKLTEFDKMGVQRVLTRLCEGGECERASNKSLQVTRETRAPER